MNVADLKANLETWSHYDWSKGGEEWSSAWGSSDALWHKVLLPRIERYVPADSVLEIAPGHGRMTHYLSGIAKRLSIVDMVPACIDACRKRFADKPHIAFFVNDGKSLDCVSDNSVDFVFSFDSLVHAEADVIDAYVRQLSRKMTPHATGFIHHSNLGAYNALLNKWIFGKPTHFRARSMRAELFVKSCRNAGLVCTHQELINWGGEQLSDCFSTFTREGSRFAEKFSIVENPNFMADAHRISAGK